MYLSQRPGQLALSLLSLTLAIGLTIHSNISQAQSKGQAYPDRTVKMIVPLTTGSGADIAGRVVAKSLTETWKQSVIIENRPGAGGLQPARGRAASRGGDAARGAAAGGGPCAHPVHPRQEPRTRRC